MKLLEVINLPNGLSLNIVDLSKEIAAGTVKVEISINTEVDLLESLFANHEDYLKVEKIFGNKLTYEYKLERSYVLKEKQDTTREELINTFKTNLLDYLGTKNFAQKLALSMLRDIKDNPYKYQDRTKSEI
jgi:hypothetical protein